MPWKVEKGHGCPAGKPWACVNQKSGKVEGCHPSKKAAQKQQAALYAKEPQMSSQERPAYAFRAVTGLDGLALRDASADEAMPTLFGRFAVFNEWTEIDSFWEGRFLERIDPGAMDRTFREERDGMRVLFQHGRDPQIGSKPLGGIGDLTAKRDGAHYEVPLLDTDYVRELLPGLREGLYGASFRFSVRGEDWNHKPGSSKSNPEGLPERTLTDVSVMEFGPVTFPAYPSASAGVRSLTDYFINADHSRDDVTGRPETRSPGGSDRDRLPTIGRTHAREARHRHAVVRYLAITRKDAQ